MRSVPSLARSFRMGRLLRPVSGLRFPPLFSVRFVEKGVQQRRFSSQSPSGNSTPNLTNSSKGTGSGSDSSTSGSGHESLKHQLLVALAYFGGCFCVVLLLTDHVFEFTRIDGPSMLPTLNRKGDRVFVWKLGYKYACFSLVGTDVGFTLCFAAQAASWRCCAVPVARGERQLCSQADYWKGLT